MKEVISVANPNFALIKYWGKADSINNIPDMSSISMTIDTLKSLTKITLNKSMKKDVWLLNGIKQEKLGQSQPTIDYLRSFSNGNQSILIESENNFPTAAGLASSASGIASIVSGINNILDLKLSSEEKIKAAILGSGSAPRSLFPGFVHLDNSKEINCQTVLEPKEWPLKIVICLTSIEEKMISSRKGMKISKLTSPYYSSWVNEQDKDIKKALKAIKNKDFLSLASVSEFNCNKMHRVMETSDPPLLYRNEVTQNCIKQINEIKMSGIDIFYTIDAGPQVKIICKPDDTDTVISKMKLVPNIHNIIEAGLGEGARIINES